MKDPIIEEIHKYREERARKFNYDIRAMTEDLSQMHIKLVDLSKEVDVRHAVVAEVPAIFGKD